MSENPKTSKISLKVHFFMKDSLNSIGNGITEKSNEIKLLKIVSNSLWEKLFSRICGTKHQTTHTDSQNKYDIVNESKNMAFWTFWHEIDLFWIFL